MLGLEFLKADHVRLGLGEPGEQVLEALVDVVDVEGGEFHGVVSSQFLSFSVSQVFRSSFVRFH